MTSLNTPEASLPPNQPDTESIQNSEALTQEASFRTKSVIESNFIFSTALSLILIIAFLICITKIAAIKKIILMIGGFGRPSKTMQIEQIGRLKISKSVTVCILNIEGQKFLVAETNGGICIERMQSGDSSS